MRLGDLIFDGVRALCGFAAALALLMLAALYLDGPAGVALRDKVQLTAGVTLGATLVFAGGVWAGRLYDREIRRGWAALFVPVLGAILSLGGAFGVATQSAVAPG